MINTRRRRFGRRKSDKYLWVVVILGIALIATTYAVSCNKGGDGPTGPDAFLLSDPPTPASPSGGQPSNGDTPTAVAPEPALADGFWQKHVTFDNAGNLSINNSPPGTYEGEYCYFINGKHPQTRLFAGETKVQGGHFKSYPVPDLASKPEALALAADSCEPVKVNVQGDAGAGTFDCNNPSNQLADAGTADLHAYVYFDIEVPAGKSPEECEQCEPGEWEIVSQTTEPSDPEAGWGSCDNFPRTSTTVPQCEECREVGVITVESNGCETRTSILDKIERRPVECECEEEEPTLINTERTLAREGKCSPSTIGINPGAQCQKTDSYLVVETWKLCEETWTTERYERVTEPCKCEEQCLGTEAYSNAEQPFVLPNSSEATETSWANTNVFPGPYALLEKNEDPETTGEGQCMITEDFGKVILLKAGTDYYYFLNVKYGTTICSDNGHGISHISTFVCDE